jgi:hypothetical protein
VSFTLTRYTHTGRDAAANMGRIKIHVTGIRKPGMLVADIFSGMPPTDNNHVRRQFLNAKGDQLDVTINDLPYGDYVLGVFVDENRNYAPDFGVEGVWVCNGQNVDHTRGVYGTPFDVLKFSFHAPELAFKAALSYSASEHE